MNLTVPQIQAKKERGEKITVLTCYDATFARLLDATAVDILMVGDSLGMVIQGHAHTTPVTIEETLYHTACVTRVTKRAHVVADMPFMSYQASLPEALKNAARLMKEGGAQSIKMEGGQELVPTVEAMTAIGIPVMAHIGMRPQTVHQMGGYKIQGKTARTGETLVKLAMQIEDAGAYSIVLEGVTAETAEHISSSLRIPTIGISAGPDCDGQVLVIYDLLGMDPNFSPRFVKKYVNLATAITDAVSSYCQEVTAGTFPGEEHTFRREQVASLDGHPEITVQEVSLGNNRKVSS